jgi:hypothetical protein
MSFLDRIPYVMLIVLALFMVMAPFVPEPHLLEKLQMLSAGALTKPIDIFDLFWHLLPTILLVMKWFHERGWAERRVNQAK